MSCLRTRPSGRRRCRDYRSSNDTGPSTTGSYGAIQDDPDRVVYFALDAEACQIKIGWTQDIDQRLSELGRKRRHPLELLGTMAGDYNLERAMHGRFRPWRVEGREWYSSEIAADVLELLRG